MGQNSGEESSWLIIQDHVELQKKDDQRRNLEDVYIWVEKEKAKETKKKKVKETE